MDPVYRRPGGGTQPTWLIFFCLFLEYNSTILAARENTGIESFASISVSILRSCRNHPRRHKVCPCSLSTAHHMSLSPLTTCPGRTAAGLFIVSTGLEKVDPLTRRTIRSHVMRGKNTRKSGRATPQRRLIQDGGAGESQSEGREVVGTEQEPWILTSPEIVSTQLAIFGGVDEMKPYMMNLLYQGKQSLRLNLYLGRRAR